LLWVKVQLAPTFVWQPVHSPVKSCFSAGGSWHEAQSGLSAGCTKTNWEPGAGHVVHSAVFFADPAPSCLGAWQALQPVFAMSWQRVHETATCPSMLAEPWSTTATAVLVGSAV
jgi:hypothetical protein